MLFFFLGVSKSSVCFYTLHLIRFGSFTFVSILSLSLSLILTETGNNWCCVICTTTSFRRAKEEDCEDVSSTASVFSNYLCCRLQLLCKRVCNILFFCLCKIVFYSCFCIIEGLLLGSRSALRARRCFQTRRHLEEVVTVGTNLLLYKILVIWDH